MRKKNPNNIPEVSGITENLKKGVTELLVLSALDVRPMYIHELIRYLNDISPDKVKVTYPYAAVYRLLNLTCIEESGKRVADDRLRSYFRITENGKKRLEAMKKEYAIFTEGIADILQFCAKEQKENE